MSRNGWDSPGILGLIPFAAMSLSYCDNVSDLPTFNLGFCSLVSNLPFNKRARVGVALSFLTILLRRTLLTFNIHSLRFDDVSLEIL